MQMTDYQDADDRIIAPLRTRPVIPMKAKTYRLRMSHRKR